MIPSKMLSKFSWVVDGVIRVGYKVITDYICFEQGYFPC